MFEQLTAIHPVLPAIVGNALLILVAVIAYYVTRRILLMLVHKLVKRTSALWDDALVDQKVFSRLAHVVPALVIQKGILLVPDLPTTAEVVVRNLTSIYMIAVVTLTVAAVLSAVNQIYQGRPGARNRPIKGFIQLAQLVLYIIGGILVIAVLIDRSPVILLSGLGAITAVLMVVFKDTLLSLAASIQLTTQELIRVGDWLEVPQFGADGDVIDVALYTITVQNWDKTISTIPTYQLVAGSFKNWRGMSESGGRRIKRSINIDLNSIHFLTSDEVERYSEIGLLKDYIESKREELQSFNASVDTPDEPFVNQRHLTNIGTLRAYIRNYLGQHPKIHNNMTLIVRQLQPAAEGLPIEIYCFSNDTNWGNYEAIQADIFDHIFAIVPEFGLRLFQQPAGLDFAQLNARSGEL
ncbi:MAG: mechanosensitive ion channel family protein [Arenicellales bacterium]